jgi:hypothetical protein
MAREGAETGSRYNVGSLPSKVSLLVLLLLICSVAVKVLCTTMIAVFGNGVTIGSGTR